MYGDEPENVFYYLTLYNEPYLQPAEPEDVDVDGILRGHATATPAAPDGDGPKRAAARVRRRGASGRWRRSALLQEDWGVQADVWSVTSWNELRRDGLAADEHNFLHPDDDVRVPYVTRKLEGAPGPVRRGVRLHARRAGPDRSVGARRLRLAGHRRVRACPTPAARCAATSRSTRRRSRCGP